jgi:uncharacterized protein DUF4136
MRIFKGEGRLALIGAVVLAVLIMGGCAATIKYSYDIRMDFSGLKSYEWAPSPTTLDRYDSLLETNARDLADEFLEQKGFTKVPEKSDLLISISYEFEYDSSQLKMLTFNIYKSEQKQLIWWGTATSGDILGSIDTDAASGDLKRVVQKIFSNFPPK